MGIFSQIRVSISRVRVLVLLLLLFTLLFSVFLAQAQVSFTTLVSNVGETDDGEIIVGDFGLGSAVRKVAQAFTTGSSAFRLREIRLEVGDSVDFSSAPGSAFEIELMTSDGASSGSRPQSRVRTNTCNIFNDINRGSLIANSEFVYTVPDNKTCILTANTEYFLVFQIKYQTSPDIRFVTVSSDAQSGVSGWGIADSCLSTDVASSQYGATGTWSDCADGKSVKLGLSGVPWPGVLLKSASDTGPSNADNITSDTTPEFELDGFTDGVTVTVTATHGTATNVVVTRSGDGDVTFTTLAEGDWTITATDTTNTATTTITIDTTAPNISVPAFAGHLGISDAYINKADSEASPEDLIATPILSDSGGTLTATYAVIASSVTCDGNQTFTSGIPQTDDVTTDGSYKICIKVDDAAGNTSQYLSTSAFTRDIIVPVVSGIQDIGTTSNPTPDLTFTTSEAGFTRVNNACGITRQALTLGANTITLSAFSLGTYPSCTFTVEDSAGNPSVAAQMNPFTIIAPIVTNVGQIDTATTVSITSTSSQAQQFTTPADPYALSAIEFEIDTVTTDPGDVTVTLQGASGGEPDGVAIASVDVSGAGTTGTKTADFSSENVTLKPSTDYFIVFSVSTGDIALQLTASDVEDAASVSGASIGNTLLTYSGSAWTSNTNSAEIAVNGSITHLYLKNTSDTGPSPLDHHTLDYTPTVVITGMTGAVNLTATATSETDVTATRSGDGDVTIPALARNKEWTITATDSSVPAKTATLVIYVGDLLVGNFTIGADVSSIDMQSRDHSVAQGFTTTDSYALESVRLRFRSFQYPDGVSSTTNTLSVSVQGVDGNGHPDGTILASVTDIPYSILTGNIETITFPKPVTLSANTQYTIVVSHMVSEDVFARSAVRFDNYWRGNTKNDEDSIVANLTGWTLANTYFSAFQDGSYSLRGSGYVFRISLQGSRIPAWTVDLHADSDTGDSSTDDITDDNTPDITVAGFGGSDVITVRATKAGESAVTATRTGNGDVTLGTLASGDWRISASNALGDTTLHITVTILNTAAAALKADSNSGSTADLITNVDTPTIVVSGFGGTASVTVTADHASASDVTTTITGNGDATLGTLADGNWIITASDGANTSDPITITIDATAPNISVPAFAGHLGASDAYITKADSEAAAQNLIATPTLSDGGTILTATYAVIASSATCDGNQTFTSGIPQTSDVTTDSSYKICIKVVDMAANTQYLSTSAFTRDIVVPTVSNVSSIGNTYDPTPDLTFTTSEDGFIRANSACGITREALTTGANTITLSTLTPNTYSSCTFIVEDSAGNPSTATSILSFTVQAGGISITALSTAPAQSRQTTATVTGTNPSDLNWVLFAPDSETCGSSLTFSNSYTSGSVVTIATAEADNTKRACFRATVAGITLYEQTDVITGIDITAPNISVPAFAGHLGPSDSYITKADSEAAAQNLIAAPNLSDGGSALTATYAVIASNAACNSGQTFVSSIPQTSDVTPDGSYKICIKVDDAAGNTSQYLSTSAFTRDIVVPTISGVSSIGNTYDSTPDLTFTTSEAGVLRAVAGCGIRQTNVSQGQNTITLATLTPNTYPSCTLTMEDSAGNPSIATSIPSFTIQAGGISITALSTAPAQSRQATATVTGTNPSDLNWVLFAPGTETCNNSLTFSNSYISGTAVTIATTEADNTKRACFRATVAGTTIYQSTDVITGIDTTAPALSFTYGTQKAADSNYTTFTSATSTVYFKAGDKFRFTDTSTDGGSGIDAATRDFVLTIGTTEEHNANNAATLSPATTHPNTVYTVGASDNGILKYTFDASDQAGNAGTQLATTFTNLFIDTTAPTTPTIDLNAASDTGSSNSDNITNDDTPTFTITNDTARVKGPGGVTIDEDNGKTAEVIAWYLSAAGGDSRTEQSGETANTFTPSALSDGTYKLSAKFIDKAGNEAESTVLTFVIDTAVPSAPTTLDLDSADDTGRSNSDNITKNTSNLTITTAAAGENGGTVQLYNGSSTIGSATTISAGTTSTDIDLAEGTHTITAKTTDVAGNQSTASTALSITVDSSVPTLALTAQTKKGSGGSFADIASSNIYLKVGDGFRLNDSSDYSIAGVDPTSTSFDLDLGTTEQHSGTGASDITATTTASRLTYTISAGDNGIFKYTFDATDEAGNAGTTLTNTLTTVFVDTTAPTTPTIDLNTASDHGISNSDNITNDDTPTFSITNDSARVKGTDGVAIDEDNGKTAEVIEWHLSAAGQSNRVLQTGETANTFTPSALSDGTYKLSAKFIDKAGNETESTVLTFVIDTAVPSAPTTLDLASADDTGRSNSDNITSTTTGLTITTAAAGENGGTVQLYNGSSTVGSATTISAGTTSTDIDLAEGTHTITAKTTDVAGNQSTASTALSITVDTTPPAQPAAPDLTAATDSGFSNSDDITRNTSVSFDMTFSSASHDFGRYIMHFGEDTDPAKGAGCTTSTAAATYHIPGATANRTFGLSSSHRNKHLCVHFKQEDLAGNRVASEVLEMVHDWTPPSLLSVTWDLPNADDTTRAEIAADGEDSPNDDGNSDWNPGKTDDYTKEDHFDLVFSNVPSNLAFGVRQQVRARVRYTPVDTSGTLLAAEDSATAEFDTIPSGATGSITISIPDTDNKRVKSTGTTQHEAHTTNFQLFVTDVAGNTAQTTTSFASVMVDTVSQTPPTPDLVAASDTGASNTDNYTNANLINLDITFPASGAPASNDEDSIINLYTWIDSNTDTVIDASELTIVSADDDGDFSTDDRAPHAPLTNDTSNRAKVTFENVHLATEGTHTLVAGLKDKAGNPEAYSTPLTIYIDRTAPDTPEAPTLNSQDDSGAIRPGAGVTEQNLYRTDHITNIDTNLSFFGCVDISDVRSTGKTDEATLTAIVRDSDNTIITDTSTPNTGTSGSSVTFGDPLQTRDGDPVRPTNCPTADTQPYTLDLDETYGATDEHHTYTITLTATDLAGNISAEGDTTTFIIDQKAPTDALGSLDMDSATDNGEDTTDNATSLTDILYTTNKHSIDNNGATAYQTRTQKTLSHYEIALQEYSGGRTQGAIFTAPSSEQITYFQGENIPEQNLNGATFPERDRQGTTGIALILKGLNLTFEQYATIFQTRIRAVDVAGNVRELFPTFSASYLLPPPPVTDIDLATTSDSGSGVSGTTTDDITALNSWTVTGSFVYRERDDSALVSQIYARVLKDSDVITSTTITNITDGSIEGICADEEATCQESDDVASTFSHTFDLSTNNLTDGDYTIELKTYNGADFGPVNTDLTVTYDTTPPDTSLLTDLALYANHPNGQPALHWIGLQKPRKSAVRVYAPEGTTPLDENTEDDDDISIRSGNNPYIRSGDIRSALDYEITLTDAAGNESERITLPPRPDISIVSLGTSKYAAVALLHEDASRTSFKSLETTGTGACTIPNDILSSGTAYTAYTDGTALTLSGNSRFCFYVAQTHDGITTHFIQDTQGAPSFAAVTVHQDDDTTISQYATTNDAYTSETSPRLTGSTLPNTPVRLYRVTRAQFTAATTNDEWTELAIDDNKILDTTSDEDMGTFSVPAPDTPLTEGEYLIAAQISLDGGTSYTDTAQVFTLHIDTTAPTAQATAPTLTTSTDDTGTSQSDGITKTTTLAFTTAALTTGEDLLTCYLNNTPADTSYQSNTCTITAPEGVHTITTTVTDRAGNESPHTTPYNLTIDTTNPAITLIRLNDADTTIDANTRFIAVAADQTTTEFSYVIETKAACDARTTFGSTTYTAGTQFDPDDSASDGYCFIARDLADNLSTLHTEDSIEGVGSFSIQGGTKESSTIYTTSGTKTITGVTAPEAKVLIKITEATDDPSTYSSSQLQDTSFATITFDTAVGETTFTEAMRISPTDDTKKVVGWIWTDKDDHTTATPAITLATLTVDDQAPIITPGTITSNNVDPSFAKQGDIITATFTTSETIQTHTASINGVTAACADANNTFTCTATLTNEATEGSAKLTTTITDKAGNTTTRTITETMVTIDATAPTATITNLQRQHLAADDSLTFTLTITDTNEIKPGTYTFTATGATLSTCTITVPADSNRASTDCTITTASGADGTPIILTIPTLTDGPGNTKASTTTTLGHVDTAAPTIDSIDSIDDTKRKKFTFTITATHNQHASNTNPETLTPTFSGDCERFDADTTWTGTGTTTYTTTLSVSKGTYKTCAITLTDEAGNQSTSETFDEFMIKGSGGAALLDAGRSLISSIFGGGSDSGEVLSFIEPLQQTPENTQTTEPQFTRDLTIGSTGDDVRALQQLLNDLGFLIADTGPGSPGQESTYFGERTRQALIRYQQANNISPASGYFGPLTRASLQNQPTQQVQSFIQQTPPNDVPPTETTPTPQLENIQTTEPQFTRDLTIGSTGDDVRALQQLLNDLGFLIADTGPGSPGQESTYFGERTRQALIRYQQANSISPASGYFGPLTRSSLQNQPTQQVQSFIQQTPPNDVPPTETTPTPQPENTQDYEPITDILYKVRQPSFDGAPSF